MANFNGLKAGFADGQEMNWTPMEEEPKVYTEANGIEISRKRTLVEKEVWLNKDKASGIIGTLPERADELPTVQAYIPPTLEDSLFCGHLVTDLDSIAGAMGAAELYGGTASRASEVNSETQFALDYWGLEQPRPIEELLEEMPDVGVCLVDHQQTSQLNKSIPVERIVGVIDHHALQNSTIITDMPIYIDIRPWGSMSTIIAHSFMTNRNRPTTPIAGMLLCAILSDTLNLQGPTTTQWDKLMASILTKICGVEDVQLLASQQFKAKSSELQHLTPIQLVNGDQKVFTFVTEAFEGSVGFAVIETTDDDIILARAEAILLALNDDKDSKGLSVLYLAVVNIVELRSNLLCLGTDEESLARAAFANGKMVSTGVMDLGGLVSRKKDFIPAITRAIKDGWTGARKGSIKKSKSDVFDLEKEEDSHSIKGSPTSKHFKKGVRFDAI